MIPQLQRLIEILREELREYGELLALLDQQQEQVVRRDAAELLETVTAVNRQSAALQSIRSAREVRRGDLARSLDLPGDAPFAQLIPRLPEDYRPLLQALVDENNSLLFRVQQRARQNHLLLRRSLELMQRVIGTFLPAAGPSVYGGDGALQDAGAARALYEAVG